MNDTNQVQKLNYADSKDLWKYFEDRADKLKNRLWAIATWLFGFNSAIIGIIFGTPLFTSDATSFSDTTSLFVLILALVGCITCFYSFFLIYDYGQHIQRNWERANFFKDKLPLVNEALVSVVNPKAECKNDKHPCIQMIARFFKIIFPHEFHQIAGLPKIARYLLSFAAIYCAGFLGIIVVSLLYFLD